jgi:tetratricopeptide (TPR) repeat protein
MRFVEGLVLTLCSLSVVLAAQRPRTTLKVAGPATAVERARQLVRAGMLPEAERTLREAIQAVPDQAELHGELGLLDYQAGRFREAVEQLGRAAQLDPKNPAYSLRLAGAIIGDRRYSVALEFLDAVKPDFQHLAEYHYNVGLAYYGIRRYQQAITALNEALRIDPSLQHARFFLANCQAVMGDLESAVQLYREALARNPNQSGYLLALGQVLKQMGPESNAEAQRVLRRVLQLHPADIPAMFALGLACEQAEDLACARKNLEEVTARFPEELPANVALARVYSRLGEKEKFLRQKEIVEKLQRADHETPGQPKR